MCKKQQRYAICTAVCCAVLNSATGAVSDPVSESSWEGRFQVALGFGVPLFQNASQLQSELSSKEAAAILDKWGEGCHLRGEGALSYLFSGTRCFAQTNLGVLAQAAGRGGCLPKVSG